MTLAGTEECCAYDQKKNLFMVINFISGLVLQLYTNIR